MTIDEKDNLRLIGKNEEDLKIISAYLQDSIVLIRDIKTLLLIASALHVS